MRRPVKPEQHGTTTGYIYGCRCAACRAAAAEKGRKDRAAHPEKFAERDRQYRAKNAEKVVEYRHNYYMAHIEEARQKHLRNTYGIDDWDELFAKQGNCCAVCGSDDPGGNKGWHTDHDHQTGAVRGILCQRCNHGLGNFHDDPEHLMAAIKYLAAATL